MLETGIKSPKLEGVKISNFRGPLKVTPSYRDSIENPQFGAQKSKLSGGSVRFDPPLARSPIDLVHQNRGIEIGGNFRVDRAKSPEILQKDEFRAQKSQLEIANR